MSRPRYLADEDLRGSIVKAARRTEPAIGITTPVAESLILIWQASEFHEWKDRIVFLPI